jgi:hypothetical protein
MKGCNMIWSRLEESNPSIMTMYFFKINELKKHHSLIQVKFKALTTKEKDADLWWHVV